MSETLGFAVQHSPDAAAGNPHDSQSNEPSGGLDQVIDQVMEEARGGKRPDLAAYYRTFPDLEGQLRDILPSLLMLEDFGSVDGTPPLGSGIAVGNLPPLKQLGDYQILREIGRGGMGVVYEAVQLSLGRHVALKVLPAQLVRSANSLERFRREAQAAAQLHHSNIVPVFELGEHEGTFFYAMQFIRGQTLDQVLDEVRRLRGMSAPGNPPPTEVSLGNSLLTGEFLAAAGSVSPPQQPENAANNATPVPSPGNSTRVSVRASDGSSSPIVNASSAASTTGDLQFYRSMAWVAVQAAEALAYAHKQGMLHRDIKPANLLLDSAGTVWVTDFGLVKLSEGSDLTTPGDVVGTLRYMAPEQFAGAGDARSDVYSLGATLYELLTLRPLLEDSDKLRLLARIRSDSPLPPSQVCPGLPRDLNTIVLKALEKEPQLRYASAEALAADLRRFLGDRPISARQAGPAERVWRWCRRNRYLATLATSVLLLLALLSAGSLASAWVYRDQRNKIEFSLEQTKNAKQHLVRQLWESRVARAEALRRSGVGGRRFQALAALREAAGQSLPHGPEEVLRMRNEALAALALVDLALDGPAVKIPDDATGVAVSRDGTLLAFGTTDSRLHVVPFQDQAAARVLALAGVARHLRFSSQGTLVAWLDGDGNSAPGRLHVVHSGNEQSAYCTPPLARFGFSFDFSPDGQEIWVARDDHVVVLGAKNGVELRRWSCPSATRYLAISPSGKQVALARDFHVAADAIDIRTTDSGKLSSSFMVPTNISSLAWSATDSLLAIGGEDSRIYLRDVAAKRLLPPLRGHSLQVTSVAFGPDPHLLASKSWDESVRLWDVRSGESLVVTTGAYYNSELLFCRDGRLGFSVGDGGARLWKVARGKECRVFRPRGDALPSLIGVAELHRETGTLLVGSDLGLRVFDFQSGEERLVTYVGRVLSVQPLPGQRLLTCGPSGLRLWPLEAKTDQVVLGSAKIVAGENICDFAATSQDGNVVAYVSQRDWQPHVLRLDDPAAQPQRLDHVSGLRLDISPDGRHVATGNWQGRDVKIWNADDATLVTTLPAENSTNVVFSPCGKYLASGGRFEFRVYRTGNWQELYRVPRELAMNLPGLMAFAHDGKLLAVNLNMTRILLLDPATGQRLAELEAPDSSSLERLRFDAESRYLIAAHPNHVVHVWDLIELRRSLRELNLDWGAEPLPSSSPLKTSLPWRAEPQASAGASTAK